MKKLLATVIARVLLAVIFALLIAALKWEYFQWGIARVRIVNTIFYPATIIFMVALLLSALLHPVQKLYGNRGLPLQNRIEKAMNFLRMAFSKLRIQFTFWGLLIAALIGLAWSTGVLQDENFRFNQVPIPWKGLEKREDVRVGVFSYSSIDNNQLDYVRNCARIVRDMKAVGVKVVIVPLPYLFSEEAKKYVEEMHQTGIVVFAVRSASDYYLSQSRKESGVRTGHITIDMFERNPFRYTFVHRIIPFPEETYPLWRDIRDVSLEALRIYYGLPENENIRREESNVVLGDFRYPIADHDKMYLGRLVRSGFWINPGATFGLQLRGRPEGQRKLEYVFPRGKVDVTPDLSNYRDTFEGKVMIIQWRSIGGIGLDLSYLQSETYARIIDHLIRGETLTHPGVGTLLVSIVSILGCGFILYRSKFVFAVALLSIFSGGMLYGSAWLFQEKGILIDMPAVIASLVVSIAVFTVLRLGYEWRLGFRPNVIGSTEQPHK